MKITGRIVDYERSTREVHVMLGGFEVAPQSELTIVVDERSMKHLNLNRPVTITQENE